MNDKDDHIKVRNILITSQMILQKGRMELQKVVLIFQRFIIGVEGHAMALPC
jgi:hypothetical protein